MKIKLAYMLALFALPVLANTPPEITNVRASQRTDTKLVDIYYDAADADGDLLKVRIEISDNDGVKYSVPAFSLTGDIGEGIAAGKDKHIVWDAGTDWDGEYSDKMRVKVCAIDAQGFPGLEWGNEVPPGGFLMGQDGGAEGSGESRHVCIPWSYWLSKYEITCWEYCRFLNSAFSSGYVELDGVTKVVATDKMPIELACNPTALLCELGDDKNIRWNVNKFEPALSTSSNLPISVTWYGAMAFARFYGYDLPTEAEWEKAARGPANDDQGEHLLFPWGNEISAAYANIKPSILKRVGYYDGDQTPVGPDTMNGYGLYDVVGNVCEWTLSREVIGYDSNTKEVSCVGILAYPQQECLTEKINNPFGGDTRVARGYAGNPLYYRKGVSATSVVFRYLTGYTYVGSSYSGYTVANYYETTDAMGFRIVRRAGVNSAVLKIAYTETFDDWIALTVDNTSATNDTVVGKWVLDGSSYHSGRVTTSGVNNTQCLYLSGGTKLYMPVPQGPINSISIKVKTTNSSYDQIYLVAVANDGKTSSVSSSFSDDTTGIVHELKIGFPDVDACACYIYSSNNVYIDDLQVMIVSD